VIEIEVIFKKIEEKIRGPEPRPLLQATILFHLRGRLIYLKGG